MKFSLLPFLFVLATLGTIPAQTTSQTAGQITCPRPTATAPVWGKLVISGNNVSCYYGTGTTTPTTWKQIGGSVNINFVNNPVLVGIFATSHSATAITTGTVDNFTITPTPTYRLVDTDIGAPSFMGSANLINGVWTISGSGEDIWNTKDQFNFQPWLVGGDCTVICRVTSISSGDPWQKIGIMVRDGYNSGSDYAMFCTTLSEGVNFQYRTNFDNNSDFSELVSPPSPGVISNIAVGYSLTGSTAYVVRP